MEKNVSTAVEQEVTEQTAPAAEQTNDKLVKLAKPYKFDDEEYSEINLSGLDKLTIEDAVLTVKKLTGDGELAAMVMPETSTAYTDELAAKATDLPIEFFKLLPIGASKKVRQMVQGAITVPAQKDESDTRPHILHLHKPYLYKGETHTEVDLSGVGSLTGMNIRQAENRMEEEDIRAIERTSNYYYCCLMASMATGKDVKFFLGLPLCEAMPLENAVNDRIFRVKGGYKEIRKAAVGLASVTHTGADFYLNLPVREMVEINEEVAEEWRKSGTRTFYPDWRTS